MHCIIHYPERPNGFGIFIIGGDGQYVGTETSSWIEKGRRRYFLTALLNEGYLIFYPDMTGHLFRMKETEDLVMDLYEKIRRQEILNPRIHIIAEGTGTFVLEPFLKEKNDAVRSIFLIQPIFTPLLLEFHWKDEPILFRRWRKERSFHGKNCEYLSNLMSHIRQYPHLILPAEEKKEDPSGKKGSCPFHGNEVWKEMGEIEKMAGLALELFRRAEQIL
jgi:hypothetical protein